MTDKEPDNQSRIRHGSALTQAGLILLGFVLTAIIIVTVLVDNSEASWEVKMGCVGIALGSFTIIAGWID